MMPVRKSQVWLPGFLDDFFGNEWVDKTATTTSPAVNVIETETDYKVEIAAPGLTKDDFKIDITEDNELLVSMEKKSESNEPEHEGKKHTYLRREFSYTSFHQRLTLPDHVKIEEIKAKMENGVLTIDIPKRTEKDKRKNMRQIEIR